MTLSMTLNSAEMSIPLSSIYALQLNMTARFMESTSGYFAKSIGKSLAIQISFPSKYSYKAVSDVVVGINC